eukprot:scaffold35399_cov400-Skeletonema_dohrnii-CCMP3373.AAC.1
MAAEGGVIRFNYTGANGGFIPRDATHVIISVRVIPEEAFFNHLHIVEVIFDENVKKVGGGAFQYCPSLRRVIMPGVEVVEDSVFYECDALTDVECGKLERIEDYAFEGCDSLGRINLPSAKIVEREAFHNCKALTDVKCDKLEIIKLSAFGDCTSLGSIDLPSARIVDARAFANCTALLEAKFGSELERIERSAFAGCPSLERITIPLKDGIITHEGIFAGCKKLKHVDLVEGEVHETIAALLMEEWRNEMKEEIDSINQILPTASAGIYYYEICHHDDGGKARAIRTWIRSVLRKIIHYKAEHQRIVDEAATHLQLALPRDIVMKNVLPFLELPSYTTF